MFQMIEPRQIIEESDSEISIKWSDDTESKYTLFSSGARARVRLR